MSAEIDPRRYLAVLAELNAIRAAVKKLEYEVVQLVRAAGASWATIGEAMGGISRQSAQRKYGQPRKRLM